MSTYGWSESLEGSEDEKRIASQNSQKKLDTAIYDVRTKFGEFLFQARDVAEFRDRVAMVKDSAMKTIDNAGLMPVTGVVRRIVGRNGALEKEFKQRLAVPTVDSQSTMMDSQLGKPAIKPLRMPQMKPPTPAEMVKPQATTKALASRRQAIDYAQEFPHLHDPNGEPGRHHLDTSRGEHARQPGRHEDWAPNMIGEEVQHHDYTAPFPPSPHRAAIDPAREDIGVSHEHHFTQHPYRPGPHGAYDENVPSASPDGYLTKDPGDYHGQHRSEDGYLKNIGYPQANRRRADMTDGNAVAAEETFHPNPNKGKSYVPEGDWKGYLNKMDQGAPSKVQRDFVPNPDGQSHTGDPALVNFIKGREGRKHADMVGGGGASEGLWNPGPSIVQPGHQEPSGADSPVYKPTATPPVVSANPQEGMVGFGREGRLLVAQYSDWCECTGQPMYNLASLDRYAEKLDDTAYFTLAKVIESASVGAPQPSPAPAPSPMPPPMPQGGLTYDGPVGGENGPGPQMPTAKRKRQSAGGNPNESPPGQPAPWTSTTSVPNASSDISQSVPGVESPFGMSPHNAHKKTAAPDYLQKANEALDNLLKQKQEDFAKQLEPINQAKQTVMQQLTMQMGMGSMGMGVMPPGGQGVNVLPQAPGMGPDGAPGPTQIGDSGAPDVSGAVNQATGNSPVPAAQAGAGGAPPGGGGAPPGGPPQQATARRRQACWPGCEQNEAHVKKVHKDKEAGRQRRPKGI